MYAPLLWFTFAMLVSWVLSTSKKLKSTEDKAVVARLIDIRKAQAEYRNIYKQYTASFDTLIDFVKTQKIPFVSKEGVLSDKQLEDGMTEKKAMALINKAKKD